MSTTYFDWIDAYTGDELSERMPDVHFPQELGVSPRIGEHIHFWQMGEMDDEGQMTKPVNYEFLVEGVVHNIRRVQEGSSCRWTHFVQVHLKVVR